MNKPAPLSTNVSSIASWVIQAMYGIIFACAGFIMNVAFTQIEHIQYKIEDMPKEYVLKIDYQVDQADLLDGLREIQKDIKHNAEYMEADYNRRMDKLEKILQDSLAK